MAKKKNKDKKPKKKVIKKINKGSVYDKKHHPPFAGK